MSQADNIFYRECNFDYKTNKKSGEKEFKPKTAEIIIQKFKDRLGGKGTVVGYKKITLNDYFDKPGTHIIPISKGDNEFYLTA